MLKDKDRFDIKLIDFDLVRDIKSSSSGTIQESPDINGSNVYYDSPEIIHGTYNEKCDIWAIGILLYYMVSGTIPFDGLYTEEIRKTILLGSFDLDSDIWFFVSEDAKDLIR